MKMSFHQSRWVQVKITALARVHACPRINSQSRKAIDDVVTDFCASLLEKFKLDEAREPSNNLAAIAFQLKKMKFTRNREIYIYLEKNLLFFGVDKMPMASLIPLMQSFKINYLHSQELFRATMHAVHKQSQGF